MLSSPDTTLEEPPNGSWGLCHSEEMRDHLLLLECKSGLGYCKDGILVWGHTILECIIIERAASEAHQFGNFAMATFKCWVCGRMEWSIFGQTGKDVTALMHQYSSICLIGLIRPLQENGSKARGDDMS